MKRITCLLLILVWLLCLTGCATEEVEMQAPVRFYFPRSEVTYGASDSVISWEERESAGHTEDYLYLVEQYLKGPKSDKLTRIFPANVTLKELRIVGTTAQVTFNDQVATLSGLDLRIACACLTATVIDLIGVECVIIQAENALLDGHPSITLGQNHILLLDESATAD